MRRWEREQHDAALDGAALPGSPCPVCGDCSLEGSGPCGEACAIAMEKAERRADIGDDWAEDVARERERPEPEEMEPEWMGLAE